MSMEYDETENNGVLFRTAFRGYNKQDVNDYIEKLVRSNEKNAEHYSSHIRSIEEDRAENAQKILELSNRNEILTGIVQSEAEARLETEKECEELKTQLESAKKEIESYTSKLKAALKEKNSIAEKPNNTAESKPSIYSRFRGNQTSADKTRK